MSASTQAALPRAAFGDGKADAAGAAGDEGDAALQGLGLRHALQLCLFQQPVFDVEGLLLRQAPDTATRRLAPRITLMALT
jgi:hypothetical protein